MSAIKKEELERIQRKIIEIEKMIMINDDQEILKSGGTIYIWKQGCVVVSCVI